MLYEMLSITIVPTFGIKNFGLILLYGMRQVLHHVLNVTRQNLIIATFALGVGCILHHVNVSSPNQKYMPCITREVRPWNLLEAL